MNRFIARVVATLLTLATAGALGGCVAETADEDEGAVAQTKAAITYVPALPKVPGGARSGTPNEPMSPEPPARVAPGTSDPGAPSSSDPEPDPIKPGDPPASH
jgi:hypothetical protein